MPRIVIVVQGGVVQEVLADQPVEALLIDHDVEFSSGQSGEGVIVTDLSGEEMQVNFGGYAVDVNPQAVDHYFNQNK